jgi:hypothetical protein
MKKMILWAVAMMMQMSVMAQEAPAIEVNENGAYELKEVVEVAGASASTLYLRAMEALSGWTGADGKSSANIDFRDKESGVVIYKGKYYLTYYKVILNGWKMYADIALKVRVKDGRAQVTVTVPTISGYFDGRPPMTQSKAIGEIVEEIKEKGVKNRPSHKAIALVPAAAASVLESMKEALTKATDDEDF